MLSKDYHPQPKTLDSIRTENIQSSDILNNVFLPVPLSALTLCLEHNGHSIHICWMNSFPLLQMTQKMKQEKYMPGKQWTASTQLFVGRGKIVYNSKCSLFTYLDNTACFIRYPCGFNSYTLQSMSKNQFHSSNSSHLLFSCLNSLICLISPHQ